MRHRPGLPAAATAAALAGVYAWAAVVAPRALDPNLHALLASPPPPTHPPLLPPTLHDALTLTLIFAICILAAGSGIGGGAALVPVYLVLGRFASHFAVALSNITILGAAISAFALNVQRRRPRRGGGDRPLIDWTIILLMEPPTIAGAVAGAFLNTAAPPWATLTGLAVVLAAVTHNVAGRAHALWLAEEAAAAVSAAGDEARGDIAASLRARLIGSGGGGDGEEGRPKQPAGGGREGVDGHAGPASPKPPAAVSDAEAPSSSASPAPPPLLLLRPPPSEPLAPPGKVAALCALFLYVAASNLLKSRLACGSLGYWAAVVGVVPPSLALTWAARRQILRALADGGDAGDGVGVGDGGSGDHDLAWTPSRTLAFPAVSAIAGLAAGLFGVGGGIVKGPVLLALGVPADVAAATSMTMILFTSAAASSVYLGFGTPADWSAASFSIGLVASAVGVAGLARALEASGGRRSLVVVAMAATLGVSFLATAWEAGAVMAAAVRAGELRKHGALCA